MLEPIDRLTGTVRGAVRSIFRISIIQRALDSGLAFLQAYGHGDPDDTQNQELLQEADIDHAGHFGITSSPPADTEGIVVDADAGLVCVAERYSLEDLATHGGSDQMPALASGDTAIYSSDGTYIFLDASGKLTIKAMTNNIEVITESGKQIKLGQDMSKTRDIAYASSEYTGSSKVAAGAALDTFTSNVVADIAAIKVDLAASAVATGVAVTLVPTTVSSISEDDDHSYVSSGSDKAEVEP
jgi:phage gp45-like